MPEGLNRITNMIKVKILSYKSPQRYAVRRTVLAAQNEFLKAHLDLEIDLTEIKALAEIEKITPVVILPSLMINDNLVCVGRYPSKEEIIGWLQKAIGMNGRLS